MVHSSERNRRSASSVSSFLECFTDVLQVSSSRSDQCHITPTPTTDLASNTIGASGNQDGLVLHLNCMCQAGRKEVKENALTTF